MVVQLQEIMHGEMLEPVTITMSRFNCQDKDVETFLKEKALDFECRDKSRTYLVFNDCNKTLVGYFTLSLNALPFKTEVSKNTIKRIDGFSKDVDAVGIILIGQLGKDYIFAKEIKDNELLDICLRTIKKAKNIIGSRFVMLECLNIDKVVSFYKENGFDFL